MAHAPMSVGRVIQGEIIPGTDSGNVADCEEAERQFIETNVKEELQRHRRQTGKDPRNLASRARRFPKSMEKIANGVARVKKDDLDGFFDFGNPMDWGRGTGEEDAIVLYQSKKALPSTDESLAHSAEYDDGDGIPLTDPRTATENCDAMNVVFTSNPGNTQQCTAIIGNFESYHVQRWMKVDTAKSTPVRSDLPLALVSRGYASRGKANFYGPPSDGKFSPVRRHWKALRTFLENVDSVLEDLGPVLESVARNNAVVILTCNMGQSALLVNFACSTRRRGFDLGNILVFPSDVETKELAEGLGLATYYDEKNMGPLPSGEARRYGDRNFKAMMYAKVLCVLYPLILGYDVLFQDVDIVWIRDPMEYFDNKSSKVSQFDVIFQHDGSNSVRYAPYSANSGFYYVRANKRTQYLFTSLIYHSDLIINWDSHQQVLVQLLAEHSSLFGLGVKVLGRDTEMFPGGYHYHRNKVFMKNFIERKTETYIFHMSWTENKDNKLLFLRQLGEWYVTDRCAGKTAADILGGAAGGASTDSTALVEPCCAKEPIFSCHYRDKPSKLPCKSSPPIDGGGRSFW
eukprot:CAMPEP_0172575534 /NCGR_PEP_ID=MMETSP1067-20121228/137261_1 /TAXON_ID=265564 ORGANISM="Thalassiosira punctigera, Strain Tpunct2005C2" /NCGR_SAMPLE_ID=MMETSP1067 /ASSEMBLY_ACC=CAM_ASM_000444 /LENGTH=572 /DNA_ID=CAMNT_0013368185 /DNA_START=288 /DNA_END=2006 /DNA_ORIENTATION=+